MNQAIIWQQVELFTFLMTALGAGLVFIFKKEMGKAFSVLFWFAAGVMMRRLYGRC